MAGAITVTDRVASGTDGSSFTFTGRSIGTAAADRYVLVGCFHYEQQVTGVTIGGVAATELIDTNFGASRHNVAIYGLLVPTGTTATIVISLTGSTSWLGMAVARATGIDYSAPLDTATANNTSFPSASAVTLNVNADTAVGGVAFGIGGASVVGAGGTNPPSTITSNTWSGLTGDSNITASGEFTYGKAGSLNASSAEAPRSISFTLGGNSETYAAAAGVVTFSQAAAGGSSVDVGYITATGQVYGPTFSYGAAVASPGFVAATGQAYGPAVSYGATTASPAFIAATGQVYAPTIGAGVVAVTPSFIAATGQAFSPTIDTPEAQVANVGFIAAVGAAFTPTIVVAEDQAVDVGFIPATGGAFQADILRLGGGGGPKKRVRGKVQARGLSDERIRQLQDRVHERRRTLWARPAEPMDEIGRVPPATSSRAYVSEDVIRSLGSLADAMAARREMAEEARRVQEAEDARVAADEAAQRERERQRVAEREERKEAARLVAEQAEIERRRVADERAFQEAQYYEMMRLEEETAVIALLMAA